MVKALLIFISSQQSVSGGRNAEGSNAPDQPEADFCVLTKIK
jgi:hypothetical protein